MTFLKSLRPWYPCLAPPALQPTACPSAHQSQRRMSSAELNRHHMGSASFKSAGKLANSSLNPANLSGHLLLNFGCGLPAQDKPHKLVRAQAAPQVVHPQFGLEVFASRQTLDWMNIIASQSPWHLRSLSPDLAAVGQGCESRTTAQAHGNAAPFHQRCCSAKCGSVYSVQIIMSPSRPQV